MITDPAQIDEIVGPTPAQIAALEAATNWQQRLQLLIPLLQRRPLALLEIRPWWLEETPEMAKEAWAAKQDRSGPGTSLWWVIPAGQTEMRVTMDASGFTLPQQVVQFHTELSYNDAYDSPQSGGGGNVAGAVNRVDKQNNPIPDDSIPVVVVQIPADPYPKHGRLVWDIPGSLTCGFNVEFSPRDYGS